MRKILFAIIALSFAFWYGCNQADPICPDTQSFDFKLILHKVSDSTSTRVLIYHPAMDTLNPDDKFPELISIPVNITLDSTVFYIDFINDTAPEFNATDSIWFYQVDSLYLNDQECGFITEFKINIDPTMGSYFSRIDSAYFTNSYLNADNNGNFEIFY